MTLSVGLLLACSGFLLAVLWMDLMFDALAGWPSRHAEQLQDSALASISDYYRRVTTASQPMGRLIPVVMVVLVGSLVAEMVSGGAPGWLLGCSAVLAGGPILLAALRTVPHAVRLGGRSDTAEVQGALARGIFRDHLVCALCILAFLTLWLINLGR